MTNVASLAAIGALVGDPARAAMLVALMDGRALTAGELGSAAGVAPPTASGHLGRLLDGDLLALERQGRHRYFRIASPSVAALLENMMSLSSELGAAASRYKPIRTGPRDPALRRARLCYDHLAGEVAVGIASSMVAHDQLEFGADGGLVTESGFALLARLEVDLPHARSGAFCRPCLDWSERRPHVGGALGRALLATLLRKDWLRRSGSARGMLVTPNGMRELSGHFDLALSSSS